MADTVDLKISETSVVIGELQLYIFAETLTELEAKLEEVKRSYHAFKFESAPQIRLVRNKVDGRISAIRTNYKGDPKEVWCAKIVGINNNNYYDLADRSGL